MLTFCKAKQISSVAPSRPLSRKKFHLKEGTFGTREPLPRLSPAKAPSMPQDGLAAARLRGHHGGRRPKLTAAQQRQAASMARGGMKIAEIARTFGCSRHTVYKALAQEVPV
jgi:DNA-binding CsgD family transcriptional regulator